MGQSPKSIESATVVPTPSTKKTKFIVLWVVFGVRSKVDEEGQTIRVVGGRTTDPENIKYLRRQADEAERGRRTNERKELGAPWTSII